MLVSSRKAIVLAILIAAASRDATAALVRYDVPSLARRSSLIICGKVTEIRSYWGMYGKLGPLILSDVTLRVDEVWKGEPAGTEVTVQLLGGRIGDRWQWCPDSPTFEKDEEVLVFLKKRRGKLWTTGWIQGKYRLARDASGSRRVRSVRGLPLGPDEPLSSVKLEVERWIAGRPSTDGGGERVPTPQAPSGTGASSNGAVDPGSRSLKDEGGVR